MATDASTSHYVIKGGVEGRERLRVLARVARPHTMALFERAGIKPGMACLDVGCGGGDVTMDLAEVVGPSGRVTGTDIDEVKLEICRAEAKERGLLNVEFRPANASSEKPEREFDVAYARFLLTHLSDPMAVVHSMRDALLPGGMIVVEDIDFAGMFCYPPHAAYRSFVDLYTAAVQKRGGDPNIGPRLPGMLSDAGFQRIEMNVVQSAAMAGETKIIPPLTMENIADALLAEGLATRGEIDAVVPALYEIARDDRTVMSNPRVVQAWGRAPA